MATPRARFQITAEDRSREVINRVRGGLMGLGRAAVGFAAGWLGATRLVGGAFQSLTRQADTLNLANNLEIDPKFLTQLEFVAGQSNARFDKIVSGVERFTRNLDEALQGRGEALNTFRQMGLSPGALARMAPEERLLTVIDRLQQGEERQRVSAAQALFGRGAGRDILNLGDRENIMRLMGEAERLNVGRTREELEGAAALDQSLNRLEQVFGAFRDDLMDFGASDFATGINRLSEILGARDFGTFATQGGEGVRGLIEQTNPVFILGDLVSKLIAATEKQTSELERQTATMQSNSTATYQ